MKYKVQILYVLIFLLSLVNIADLYSQSKAKQNEIIIIGQVTSKEVGIPINDYKVMITSRNDVNLETKDYYNEVYTDEEGYYYDTIITGSNDGGFVISTTDQNGKTVDTVLLYRFIENITSVLVADLEISYQSPGVVLQARFKVFKMSNNELPTFKFYNITDNDSIVYCLWDFGDGTTSFETNPEHTYQYYGLYKVNLYVVAKEGDTYYFSDISKQFYSTDKEYYHMGGHAFSVHFPIDKGFAYLYMINDEEKYLPVDTVTFDTLGYYYFYHIPEGNYIVKVQPRQESQYYGILLPTYYGDEYFWQNANIINLTHTSWEYDIKLEMADGINTGNGEIGGNVKYINSLENYTNDEYAEGVQIYLFDESENMLTYRFSDERGGFNFNQLYLGSYYIYPEVTGVNSDKQLVQLTLNNPVVNDVEILVDLDNTNAIFHLSDNGVLFVGIPYPNPAQDEISIDITDTSNDLLIDIYNINGQKVKEVTALTKLQSRTVINIEDLENGIYFLNVYSNSASANYKFVISR